MSEEQHEYHLAALKESAARHLRWAMESKDTEEIKEAAYSLIQEGVFTDEEFVAWAEDTITQLAASTTGLPSWEEFGPLVTSIATNEYLAYRQEQELPAKIGPELAALATNTITQFRFAPENRSLTLEDLKDQVYDLFLFLSEKELNEQNLTNLGKRLLAGESADHIALELTQEMDKAKANVVSKVLYVLDKYVAQLKPRVDADQLAAADAANVVAYTIVTAITQQFGY